MVMRRPPRRSSMTLCLQWMLFLVFGIGIVHSGREQRRFTGEVRYKGSKYPRGGAASLAHENNNHPETGSVENIGASGGGKNQGTFDIGNKLNIESSSTVGGGSSPPSATRADVSDSEGEAQTRRPAEDASDAFQTESPEHSINAKKGKGSKSSSQKRNKGTKRSLKKIGSDTYIGHDPKTNSNKLSMNPGSSVSNTIEEALTPAEQALLCPRPCNVADDTQLNSAIHYYWSERYERAFDCACAAMGLSSGSHHMAQAIMYAVTNAKNSSVNSLVKPSGSDTTIRNSEGEVAREDIASTSRVVTIPVYPPLEPAQSVVPFWEILAPFPVGKLEVDGDPAFGTYSNFNEKQEDAEVTAFHPVRHILTMPSNSTSHSELMAEAKVTWKKQYPSREPSRKGTVELRADVHWSGLVQGVSSRAVLEFQGWARASTYASKQGTYGLSCQGVHTVYVANDRNMRILTGDVYGSGRMTASVDLKIGPVGIIIPLRGSVGLQFRCQLSEAPIASEDSLLLFPIKDIPHLLRLEDDNNKERNPLVDVKKDSGLLLSRVFTLPVHNTQTYPLSLRFTLESPSRGVSGTFGIRLANTQSSLLDYRRTGTNKVQNHPLIIGPGQVLYIPLEIFSEKSTAIDSEASDESKNGFTFLPCREGFPFTIIVTPSRGLSQQTDLQLKCRHSNESFLVSYVDHDGAVTQAAVLMPLPVQEKNGKKNRNRRRRKSVDSKAKDFSLGNGNIQEGSRFIPTSPEELKIYEEGRLRDKKANEEMPVHNKSESSVENLTKEGDDGPAATVSNTTSSTPMMSNSVTYPVLLSLHGSGVEAIDQANSYKFKSKSDKDSSSKDFTYGVEGFWVVAPTRFGAHNWEGVGELSARQGVLQVQQIMENFPQLLPQVWRHDGIIAGHSMGAHGSWLMAANSPQNFVCAIATAGWIRKEEYDTSNAFFHLDVQNSHVSPILQSILARSMSEYHVDQFTGNMLQVRQIHVRVGSEDQTTSPWFSRRMYRLLAAQNHRNVVLEEVSQKQHWWWDTIRENDGGVMNDVTMRALYHSCFLRSNMQRARKLQLSTIQAPQGSAAQDSAESFNKKNITNASDILMAEDAVSSKDLPPQNQIDSGKNRRNVVDKNSAESNTKRHNDKEIVFSSAIYTKGSDSTSETEAEEDIIFKDFLDNHPCSGKFVVEATNLAYSAGSCGIRILQQQQQLEKSTVRVQCSKLDKVDENAHTFSNKQCNGDGVVSEMKHTGNEYHCSNDENSIHDRPTARQLQKCKITTRNVLRLSITFDQRERSEVVGDVSSTYRHNRIANWIVDSKLINMNSGDLYDDKDTVNLCWNTHHQSPIVCNEPLNVFEEKHPGLQGPMRMVTTRPLLVVYGTPRSSSSIRVALKDFAIYIANAHAAAHGSFVRAVTDLEYRAGNYAEKHGPESTNLLLLGGPSHNKVAKALSDGDNSTDSFVPFAGNMPVTFRAERKKNQHSANSHLNDAPTYTDWFRIGEKTFDADLHSVLFAFPYSSSSHAALALCISSNNVKGYMHATRLAWPTVPPMVRAPLANYMPDYVVFDESIWVEGFGGVSMAGYWDTWWKYDATQTFVR